MAAYQHRTIIARDIKTHFLEAGSGPDLILLHGGEYGASAEITWRYNIDALAAKFHVVAPDLLGWGQTEKIYSFSDPAGLRIRHVQRFLKTLGIGKAFFVGNSAGGGLILRTAVRQPPLQIQKMVTICGNASVFKTTSQADLDNYTPSMENMKRIVALLYHDAKWQTEENIRERYESSILPGAWRPCRQRVYGVQYTRRARQPRNSSSSFSNLKFPY